LSFVDISQGDGGVGVDVGIGLSNSSDANGFRSLAASVGLPEGIFDIKPGRSEFNA
jgi:hypothetical protein